MADIAPDWEIIARKTNRAWLNLFFIVLQTLLVYPPDNRSSVTFTLRNRASGELRKVTADSMEEAAILVAQGEFDSESV